MTIGTDRSRLTQEESGKVGFDIGHGGDGGTGALDRCVAIDGNGGGHGIERIDRRALVSLEELSGVGAETLDEASLPFGVEGVEAEGGLAGAGDAGNGDELTRVELERDGLEIVGPCVAEDGTVHALGWPLV